MSEEKTGKPLVQTTSFWGWVAVVVPAISDTLQQALGSGFIPPHVAPWIYFAGAALGLFGRFTADEPVTSIVIPKKPESTDSDETESEG